MYLTVCIALGVFGGLWLFVRWSEWRVDRPYRREVKALKRQVRQQDREHATAEWEARLAREAAARSGG